MECKHDYIEKQTERFPNGGYMILRYCVKCHDANGFGFINEEHELHYLNNMIDNE